MTIELLHRALNHCPESHLGRSERSGGHPCSPLPLQVQEHEADECSSLRFKYDMTSSNYPGRLQMCCMGACRL